MIKFFKENYYLEMVFFLKYNLYLKGFFDNNEETSKGSV